MPRARRKSDRGYLLFALVGLGGNTLESLVRECADWAVVEVHAVEPIITRRRRHNAGHGVGAAGEIGYLVADAERVPEVFVHLDASSRNALAPSGRPEIHPFPLSCSKMKSGCVAISFANRMTDLLDGLHLHRFVS